MSDTTKTGDADWFADVWDDSPQDGNLVATPAKEPETETDNEEPEKETEEIKVEDVIDDDFAFGELPEEEDEKPAVDNVEGDKEKAAKDAKEEIEVTEEQINEFYTNNTKLLMTEGILSTITEDDLPEEMNEEAFKELQAKEFDNRTQALLDGWKAEMTPEGAAFIQASMNGMSFTEFQNQLSTTTSFKDLDPENEKHHETIMKRYMQKVEEKDDDEITEVINLYKDKGILDDKAAKYHKKMVAIEDDEIKRIEAESKDAKDNIQAQRKVAKANYSKIAGEEDTFTSIRMKGVNSKELASYIADPDVKMGGNRYLTQFQSDINSIVQEPKAMVQLAALVKLYDPEAKAFDLSSIENAGKQKKVKEVKNTLMGKTKVVKPAGGTNETTAATFLADNFK